MRNSLGIGILIGFIFGGCLVGGIFYALYLQISTELFEEINKISKTVAWLGAKVHGLANEDDKD